MSSTSLKTIFPLNSEEEVPEKITVYINTDQHSGKQVPVFAKGKVAENFQGIYGHNEINHKILQALNHDK